MPPPSDAVPLSVHRAALARYLSGIVFPFSSVAGKIIQERLPVRYARDPVRACLLLWACAATGGESAEALPVAAAFDLFDRFMLLHDELTDAAAETVARWGLGQSLNAGDALYALAFRSLAGDVTSPAKRLQVARLVAQAVLEAIEGGAGDVARRSALTAAALQAGAIMGGAPEPVSATFARAGRALGMAESADAASAARFARKAIAMLRPCTRAEDLAAFSEAALYVARRAA